MPISIHLPAELLVRVDERAQRLGLSRSGYIVETLRKDLEPSGGWSPGFFQQLGEVTPDDVAAAEELKAIVRRRRSRKGPPRL